MPLGLQPSRRPGGAPLQLVMSALILLPSSVTSAARNLAGTCPSSQPYNSAAANAFDLVGPWNRFFLNYPVRTGNDGADTPKNYSLSTQVHFDRIQPNGVSLAKANFTGYIPDHDNVTVFGPATLEYKGTDGWRYQMLLEYVFRLVPPCTGAYEFRFEADGVRTCFRCHPPIFLLIAKARCKTASQQYAGKIGRPGVVGS
jgi:hypothetical protein